MLRLTFAGGNTNYFRPLFTVEREEGKHTSTMAMPGLAGGGLLLLLLLLAGSAAADDQFVHSNDELG